MRYISVAELQRLGWSHDFVQRIIAESGIVVFKSPDGETLMLYRDFVARVEQITGIGLLMMRPSPFPAPCDPDPGDDGVRH